MDEDLSQEPIPGHENKADKVEDERSRKKCDCDKAIDKVIKKSDRFEVCVC